MLHSKVKFVQTICLLLICIIVATSFAACSCSGNINNDDYNKITNPVSTDDAAAPSGSTEVALVDNPINFDELSQINSDLYAWIKIPDTVIDYPVAQSSKEDDNYYLHHNYLGNYEFAGTIYSQRHNTRQFIDRVTLLYGHNMLNGSMFAALHKFSNKDFFNEHEYMYIYIDGHILTYRIFAAYEYDDRHILNSFDFSDDEVYSNYLKECLNPRSNNSNVRSGVELDTDSRIVTLSTCTNYNSNLRYLVQGVLIKDELTR